MRLSSICSIALATTFAATAAMAAASDVNIADPNATSRVAKVEVGNRLAVQEVSPATFYHSDAFPAGENCFKVATPPAGKALIIRQVRLNVYQNPSPGPGQDILIFVSANCTTDEVADVNPQGIGQVTTTFDPGVAVPNGSFLSVLVLGSVDAEVFADGYKVDASVAPQAGGQSIQVLGKSRQQQ